MVAVNMCSDHEWPEGLGRLVDQAFTIFLASPRQVLQPVPSLSKFWVIFELLRVFRILCEACPVHLAVACVWKGG